MHKKTQKIIFSALILTFFCMGNLKISPDEQESTRSEPLPSLSEDSFEENDVFSEAAEITNGFSETLYLNDDDWFNFSTTPNQLISLNLSHSINEYIPFKIMTPEENSLFYGYLNGEKNLEFIAEYSTTYLFIDHQSTFSQDIEYSVSLGLGEVLEDDSQEEDDSKDNATLLSDFPHAGTFALLDEDWYNFSTTINQEISIEIKNFDYDIYNRPMKVKIYEDYANGTYDYYRSYSFYSDGTKKFLAESETTFIKIYIEEFGCYYEHYDLNISRGPVVTDDDLEENDKIDDSVIIDQMPFTESLTLLDDDWFNISTQANQEVFLNINNYEIKDDSIRVFIFDQNYEDPCCNEYETFRFDPYYSEPQSFLARSNNTFIKIDTYDGYFKNYDLSLELGDIILDDSYEQNDLLEESCLLEGTSISTSLTLKDEDWFNISTRSNQQISILIDNFAEKPSSIDVYILANYEDNPWEYYESGRFGGTGSVVRSMTKSNSDDELQPLNFLARSETTYIGIKSYENYYENYDLHIEKGEVFAEDIYEENDQINNAYQINTIPFVEENLCLTDEDNGDYYEFSVSQGDEIKISVNTTVYNEVYEENDIILYGESQGLIINESIGPSEDYFKELTVDIDSILVFGMENHASGNISYDLSITSPTIAPPQIVPIQDTFEFEKTHPNKKIQWVLHDYNPSTYSVSNGTSEIASGTWVDGEVIEISLDQLEPGSYEYTITAIDNSTHSNTHTISIIITEENNTDGSGEEDEDTAPGESLGVPGFPLLITTGISLAFISALFLKYKQRLKVE